MGGIDVTAERLLPAPRDVVTAYAMDPAHDPDWISGVSSVEVLTDGPLAVGTRVARVASFLGRRIEYVLEVTTYDPGERLEMRSVSGPFPMQVGYAFEDAADGTRASLRVQGDASGFYRVAARLVAMQVQRSLDTDLANLAERFGDR